MDIFFKFTASARKHRVAKGRAREAMSAAFLVAIKNSSRGPVGIFVGADSRGVELEIGIVGTDDDQVIWLVIHVMPTQYRK